MPTQNDKTWQGWESEFFSRISDGDLSKTPSAQSVVSKVADNRQILNLLLLIDVSGSMRGKRIAQVNYALENIIKELRKRDDVNSVIKIGVMEFSDKAEWVTPQPLPLDDYPFMQIEAQPWITCYGKAFDLLNEKLRREGFLDPLLGEYFAPLILFITDGEPVDNTEYPAALERLQKNGWFRKSSKYAIAVGEESRNEEVCRVLTQFTGVRENVRYADEGDALCSLIEFIAVRGSEVQTSMVSSGGEGDPPDLTLFSKTDPSLFSSMFADR